MRPSSSYDVYFRRESNGKYFLLSFLLGHSTLVREIFHIMCTDAFLVFQAHSSGHILMGVILPRILFKCRSYSALWSPLSLHPTSFLSPPSERPSLPKQRLPQQEPTLALLLYPASPRAALSQVAPISRSLPTIYQLTTHSIPCYDRSSGIVRGRCRISDFSSEMLSFYKCCAKPVQSPVYWFPSRYLEVYVFICNVYSFLRSLFFYQRIAQFTHSRMQ